MPLTLEHVLLIQAVTFLFWVGMTYLCTGKLWRSIVDSVKFFSMVYLAGIAYCGAAAVVGFVMYQFMS